LLRIGRSWRPLGQAAKDLFQGPKRDAFSVGEAPPLEDGRPLAYGRDELAGEARLPDPCRPEDRHEGGLVARNRIVE
jgi:hypothetical protein